ANQTALRARQFAERTNQFALPARLGGLTNKPKSLARI
ncbi:hypothetical protein, partial [Methylomonas fluvii]